MALLPDTLQTLADSGVAHDTINDFETAEKAFDALLSKCAVAALPNAILSLVEMALAVEKSLPRKCPSTESIQTVMDKQLASDLRAALDGMKECLCDDKKQPKKPERAAKAA